MVLIYLLIHFINLLVYPFTCLFVGFLISLFISLIHSFTHLQLVQGAPKLFPTGQKKYYVFGTEVCEHLADAILWKRLLKWRTSQILHNDSASCLTSLTMHHPLLSTKFHPSPHNSSLQILLCGTSCSSQDGSELIILQPMKKFNTMQRHISQTYQTFQQCCHCRQHCWGKGVHAEGTYFNCEQVRFYSHPFYYKLCLHSRNFWIPPCI